MYSKKNITKMVFSLNCIILDDTTTFPITLGKIIILDNIQYDISEFRISNLKRYIFSKKKESKLSGISDPDDLNLWQVNVSKDKLEGVYTTEHITNELKGKKMDEVDFITNYFDVNHRPDKNIHIIVVPSTSTDYLYKRPRLDFNNIPLDLGQSPTQLLHTGGCSWDYQESSELEQELRKEVQGLYNVFKENKCEKTNTPIFLMTSGARCGKSRNATELPKILCKIFKDDPELESRFQEALIINISFENDTRINMKEERNANDVIAKRMLYQLQNQGLHWVNIRDDKQSLSIISILKRCAKEKKVAIKKLTVILIVDGLQTALINPDDDMKKDSLFYSLMTEISLLVINKQSPLIIACCTATLARPFHEIVQVSHQKRVFLQILSDMGGNGRALEALQSAIEGVDFENSSFLSIAEQVYYKLKDHYSEWISYTCYLIPVLRAIMMHTKLVLSAHIPGTDILPEELSKLGLVKLEKQDDLSDKGILTCPYIWLWLMANASGDSILCNWNFKYYSEIQNKEDPTIPPGCQFWQHFKHFIASFRVLKSNVFEINQEIELQDIHTGARHNFGSATIRNVPLLLKKAIRRESTKSSAYSTNKMVTCKEGDDQIDIDLTDASVCIINEWSAPAGDSFCPIYLAGSTQQFQNTVFHTECHQYKSTIVNQTTFNEEYKKASDKGDVFLLYTCGPSNIPNLPLLSAIVDCNNWKLYFGPFVGRAFFLARSDKFNINNCSKSEMTSIYGIGSKCADILMNNRPYCDLEDCIARTNISRNFLINFQFSATPSSTSPN
ncbi:crinkler (CRN) family protein, putative [Rhizophagus irregularis DAOM 181602=DAOM 197198]|nr:crinkler (CRN) family protein, putative [Rhizophagus irregularis DAOM 181602=DAOM 197198]